MDPRRLLPALTALACACVVATLVASLARPDDRPARDLPAREQRVPPAAPSAASGAAGILAAWDVRRSAAWAAGDRAALALALSNQSQLAMLAHRHEGFWAPMDTLKEKQRLESLYESGHAPWQLWATGRDAEPEIAQLASA